MPVDEDQAVQTQSLGDMDEILTRFERSAVGSQWKYEGSGVSTVDRRAEDVKTVSRELRRALTDAGQIPPNADRVGAIVRAEGPCSIKLKDNTHVIVVAVHGVGREPRVGEVALPAKTITHVPDGNITIDDSTTVYLVLLGS